MVKIWHNNRCGKSRSACEILKEKGINPTVVEYLKTPPSTEDLKVVIKLLGIKPEELVRKNEELYKHNYSGREFSDNEWVSILAENPILIERPIVIHNNRAVIGRPPEKVLELFN